ncbi:hypothetical protein MBLNU457_4724t1 [Dothideomycetes sp. NU457]
MIKSLLFFSALSTLSIAAPTPENGIVARQAATGIPSLQPVTPLDSSWSTGGVYEYPIHASCNHSERALLRQGLDEMIILAQHAKDHILRFGNSSRQYTDWFGKAPTAGPIGWYDRVINADKAGVLFRCDDADGNCAANPTWAGHWRGSNATQETVICERSFASGVRWPLAAVCSRGYTVVNSPASQIFATDLLHRVFHLPRISEGIVGHYADTYPEMMELAMTSPGEAVSNSDTLQHFAIDVYAYDIANPNQGCTGQYTAASSASMSAASTSSTSVVASASAASTQSASASAPASATSSMVSSANVATASPVSPVAAPASTVQSAASSCHTHDDGFVHC